MIKDLLIAQLTDIHATMLVVHKRNKALDMSAWITELAGSKENHFCDTVACICGWQSLGELTNFPQAKEYQDAANDPEGVALRLSNDLDEACSAALGYSNLVASIYDADVVCRLGYAQNSILFNEEELGHPHLTGNPTALEAANYVALCIEKVKAYD